MTPLRPPTLQRRSYPDFSEARTLLDNMISDLQIALSRLASNELQQRSCVGATHNEYLLPEELLGSALNWAEMEIASRRLSAPETDSVRTFAACGGAVADEVNRLIEQDAVSVESLLTNPVWVKAREAAAKCLVELGLEFRCEMP